MDNYTLQIDNVIVDKSKAFALKVIALYKKLYDTNREFVMGTSKNFSFLEVFLRFFCDVF